MVAAGQVDAHHKSIHWVELSAWHLSRASSTAGTAAVRLAQPVSFLLCRQDVLASDADNLSAIVTFQDKAQHELWCLGRVRRGEGRRRANQNQRISLARMSESWETEVAAYYLQNSSSLPFEL